MFTTTSALRRATAMATGCGRVRCITSTATRAWSEVRPQVHAGGLVNKHLQLPQTVAVIGAPMTRASFSLKAPGVAIVTPPASDWQCTAVDT